MIGSIRVWEGTTFITRVVFTHRNTIKSVNNDRSEKFAAVKKNPKSNSDWTVIGYYDSYEDAEQSCQDFVEQQRGEKRKRVKEDPLVIIKEKKTKRKKEKE